MSPDGGLGGACLSVDKELTETCPQREVALHEVVGAHEQDIRLTAESRRPLQSFLLGVRCWSGTEEKECTDESKISTSSVRYCNLRPFPLNVPKIAS